MVAIFKYKPVLTGLIILSIFSFLFFQSLTGKMEMSINNDLSVTSLQTVTAIINQINFENDDKEKNDKSNSSSRNNKNQKSLKNEIEKAKDRLSKEDYKSAKSNYKKMSEHIDKLEKFKQNPTKYDNKGFLKNAPNEQIKQQIVKSRINHLAKEIRTFYNNIVKILNQ